MGNVRFNGSFKGVAMPLCEDGLQLQHVSVPNLFGLPKTKMLIDERQLVSDRAVESIGEKNVVLQMGTFLV
jgi:hypothetical protein